MKNVALWILCLVSAAASAADDATFERMSSDAYKAMLHDATVDSRTPMTIVEKRMQGRDHPVLVGVPETYYLKCFILRRVE